MADSFFERLEGIRIHRASPEDLRLANDAVRRRDWDAYYAHSHQIIFTFKNGEQANLRVSASALSQFVEEVRFAEGVRTTMRKPTKKVVRPSAWEIIGRADEDDEDPNLPPMIVPIASTALDEDPDL